MPSLNPIQLLEKELHENEVSLAKSTKLYENNLIDYDTHDLHKKNLKLLIEEYTYAIYVLNSYKRK